MLTSLSGFQNIQAESITTLTIHSNPLLEACSIESICQYLQDPSGTANIHNNALGCNNPAEILANCVPVAMEIGYVDKQLVLSPNPVESILKINNKTNSNIPIEIKILDRNGRPVKVISKQQTKGGVHYLEIDVQHLSSGVYFCIVITHDEIRTTKMIKL